MPASSSADKKLKKVIVYTDGACSGNPGAGGWAAILRYGEHEKVLSGYDESTTNNRMELLAVINGLAGLKERCSVTLYSDSAYVVDNIVLGRLDTWMKNGWRKLSGKKEPVKNDDLWKQLVLEREKHEITFIKIKGHADNEFNNRCDEIAKNEIKRAAADK